jgi:hypothetical protein
VTLLESVSVADLRRIISASPKFHPALFALALHLLHEGATADALQHARRALEQAPPAMASGYADELNATLQAQHQEAAAETLRRDFSTKLRKGEAETKREQ